jgi:hypothetical protein
MIWMAVVAIDGDGGGGGGDDENDGNGEGSGRNGANWEVGQIRGTDGEGTMFDDGGTGTEVTAEGICFMRGTVSGFLFFY